MKKISILIADDEPLTRMGLKVMLEEAGYSVCGEACDGINAVNMAMQLLPDIVILDIRMPGYDGIEVAKILQSVNIPTILLTAYSQQSLISRAEKVLAYSYLIKPVSEEALIAAVRLTYARWKEIQKMQQELKKTKETLSNQKIIGLAKALVAKEKNISEYDAYQAMLHEAMRKRITLIELASKIAENRTPNINRLEGL